MTFEYLTVSHSDYDWNPEPYRNQEPQLTIVDRFNKLGGQGWELVSTVNTFTTRSQSQNGSYMESSGYVSFFKRVCL